jgi:hypothetical protein
VEDTSSGRRIDVELLIASAPRLIILQWGRRGKELERGLTGGKVDGTGIPDADWKGTDLARTGLQLLLKPGYQSIVSFFLTIP